MPARQTYALCLAYDGRPYLGFQPQLALPTVGGVLHSALRRIGIDATPFGASRTDARVQAWGQIASFQSRLDIDPITLTNELNEALPSTVHVRTSVRALPSFHAHWSSTGKIYRYRLFSEQNEQIDPSRLDFALRLLSTRTDLSAFSASRERDKGKIRTIAFARLLENTPDSGLLIEFEGVGFGRYQIRNMIAAALAMGQGHIGPDALLSMAQGTRKHPFRAAAEGLCLWKVLYPDALNPFGFRTKPSQFEPAFLERFATKEECASGTWR
ncbi:MAG: hypothetical protein LBM75_06190 [Myxococcales bacterium]|jgi:tRNA pseudouridine38-40 synthase|nr:hypothetical protein [Myxococcales bacterium]